MFRAYRTPSISSQPSQPEITAVIAKKVHKLTHIILYQLGESHE
jgi:hypothetical protein